MLAKDFETLDKLVGNYMLVGDDMYLKDKVLANAKSRLPEGIVEFNFNVLECGKDSGREIVDTLNMAPALSDMRIVYVKEIKEKLTKDSLDLIKKYLEDPNLTSILIVNDPKGYLNSVKSNFINVDCNSYGSSDSIGFIKAHAKELGGSINHAAAKLLAEYCVYDMMRIDAELKKLVEYKEGVVISENDIIECVHADVDYEIYEIANAVGDKNVDKALTVIANLMQSGLKASDVLSQLSKAFRRMLYTKLSPLDDSELARILEVKPFAIKKTRERLKKFSPMKLKEIYDNINDMEYKFKSGVMSDTSALDDTLVKIFA